MDNTPGNLSKLVPDWWTILDSAASRNTGGEWWRL